MKDIGNTSTEASVWLLLDDRVGNRSQCLGVAGALGMPYEEKHIRYNALGALPNFVTRARFVGLSLETKSALEAPWPQLVIAAGRRTASAARAIKRKSNGHAKLVQIMYPGNAGIGEFDLVAVPSHDKVYGDSNLLTIQGAPHAMTPERLIAAKEQWESAFECLPKPRIAVFLGGRTRRRRFDAQLAGEFGRAVNKMAAEAGGSLMVSTSRRTEQGAADAFASEISVPDIVYQWGDETENPYVGYLACADAIVVSGDSISMSSEACAGTGPVYIYAPPGFVVEKHQRMHKSLYESGFARPFGEPYTEWHHAPLNAAEDVANAIRNRLGIGETC